jgi:hypothetical protein
VSALRRTAAAKAKKKGKSKARTDATGRDLDNVATDGIDIQRIEVSAGVKHSNGTMGASDNIVFSCWDFAGQDVYYHTHQFFISDRSIYLVGFNMEVEDEAQALARVEYWLQSVNARLPGAPIVVFGTHAGSKKCTKDYIKTWEKRLTNRYKKRVRLFFFFLFATTLIIKYGLGPNARHELSSVLLKTTLSTVLEISVLAIS